MKKTRSKLKLFSRIPNSGVYLGLASDISLKILHPSGHPRGLAHSGCLPGGPTRGARGRHSGRRESFDPSFGRQDSTRQHESLEDAGMLTERILFMFLRQECTRMQAHGTTEWDYIVAGSRLPATTPHGFGPRWLYCAAY